MDGPLCIVDVALPSIESVGGKWIPLEKNTAGKPWVEEWTGPLHVLFGHDAPRGIQQQPGDSLFTGLDSGCCSGGKLTACVLPGFTLISVNARSAYCAPPKG